MELTRAVLSISTLFCLISFSSAEMIRQCMCQESDACLAPGIGGLMACGDKCQHHVASTGASYAALRQCLQQAEPRIQGIAQCQKRQHANSCARGPGGMVQKRYLETLKLAAFTEINRMLSRSGVTGNVQQFLGVGRKFAGCVLKCMERSSIGRCYKDLNCGLDLPSDATLVQSAKQCAIQSGFNTQGIQQLCNCAANAGIRNLAQVCPRLQIF